MTSSSSNGPGSGFHVDLTYIFLSNSAGVGSLANIYLMRMSRRILSMASSNVAFFLVFFLNAELKAKAE